MGKLQDSLFSKTVEELSIRSTRNCLAASLFSAKFHTREQLVTCGTAHTPPGPSIGGLSRMFPARSGFSLSAARSRLMEFTVDEVFRASIARTLPAGPQLSASGVPPSS